MAQKTETISAGENIELTVADLPENLQRLVAIYDETNERLAKAKNDALILSASSQWFLNSITAGVDAFLKSKNSTDSQNDTSEESSETVSESEESSEG